MDLTNLSELELHQLLSRINEELARRHHVQLTPPSQALGCRVVQVVFKSIPGMVEEVLDNLRIYGPTEKHRIVTDQGTSTMTVYYSDPRDAEDAVKKLNGRYVIKLLENPPVTEGAVVQVVFDANKEDANRVYQYLACYGWIGLRQTVTKGEKVTLMVTYEDARNAKDAVREWARRYNIKILESGVIETVKS